MSLPEHARTNDSPARKKLAQVQKDGPAVWGTLEKSYCYL